jgi:hypothetical protein
VISECIHLVISREDAFAIHMCDWYDDPCFDDVEESINGRVFKGDSWRRLMQAKEIAPATRVVSVAGTTFHRSAFEQIQTMDTAVLIPEPENPYDSKAMRVEVGGLHVGYLPRGSSVPPQSVPVLKCGVDPPHVWIAVP